MGGHTIKLTGKRYFFVLILAIFFLALAGSAFGETPVSGCDTGDESGHYSTINNGDGTCTITYQPNGTYGKDNFMFHKDGSSDRMKWNYGSSDTIILGRHSWHSEDLFRGLIKFDTSILSGLDVMDASLNLYLYDFGIWEETVSVNMLRRSWGEGNKIGDPATSGESSWSSYSYPSSWDEIGASSTTSDIYGSAEDTTTITLSEGWRSWNITDAVDGFASGSITDYGFRLKASEVEREYGTSSKFYFYSSDSTNSTYRPKLVVTYPSTGSTQTEHNEFYDFETAFSCSAYSSTTPDTTSYIKTCDDGWTIYIEDAYNDRDASSSWDFARQTSYNTGSYSTRGYTNNAGSGRLWLYRYIEGDITSLNASVFARTQKVHSGSDTGPRFYVFNNSVKPCTETRTSGACEDYYSNTTNAAAFDSFDWASSSWSSWRELSGEVNKTLTNATIAMLVLDAWGSYDIYHEYDSLNITYTTSGSAVVTDGLNVTNLKIIGENECGIFDTDDLIADYSTSVDATSSVVDCREEGTSIAVLNMPFDVEASSSSGTFKDYSSYENNGTLILEDVLGPDILEDSESFESSFGDWSNAAGNDINWQRNSGGTSSGSTGPSSANDGSYYIYPEMSGSVSGETSIVEYTKSSATKIDFYYHQYGLDQGTLYLEGYDGSSWNEIWSSTGNQGNQWNHETQTFDQVDKLRFRNVAAGGYRGDISLDIVEVFKAELIPGEGSSVTGKIGGAFDFSQTSHANIPDDTSLDITDEITIELWVKTTDAGKIIAK